MGKTLVDNAADERQIKIAEKTEKFIYQQKLDDAKIVLGTPAGRRFIYKYLELCNIFSSSLADEHMIYFNEGMRNVGLQLLNDVNNVGIDTYTLMLKENKEDE